MDNLFNTENEEALLATLLQHPDKVYDLQKVKPYMFGSEVNRELFTAVTQLAGDHLVPDMALLTGYLGQNNKLDTIGGTPYLQHLIAQQYKEENLKKYESLVVEAFQAKTLISMSAEIPGIIGGSGVETAKLHISKILDALSVNSGGESTAALVDALRESWDTLAKRIQNPGQVGWSTGFTSIDKVVGGIDEGDLWMVAARPSVGKSAWACNSALYTAKLGNPTLIFSYEMTKHAIIERILAIETGLSIIDIHLGLVDQKGLDKIRQTVEVIKSLPIYIDAFPGDINYICSTIKKYVSTHGVRVVYIDYVQLMCSRDDDQTKELGRISRLLKLLGKELGIAIIVISQLNREVEKRDDKRPFSSDLRQAGTLEEDADKVVMLFRDFVYNPKTKNPREMEFIIRKNRQGPIGTIALDFCAETNKIMDGK
jgi:replicative DNA helicase